MKTATLLAAASLATLSFAASDSEASGPPDSLFSGKSGEPADAPNQSGKQDLTDAELKAYDGSDPSKPLYLAINGTIYDVSAGRGFYGPGGHYGHFAGRDATRAWVTECWETEDQLTHDMRGLVEAMFLPKYMDEELSDAADGKAGADSSLGDLKDQAKKLVSKFGRPSRKERKRRREADRPEAEEKLEQALGKWVSFFAAGGKYPTVGKVVREEGWEESAPEPPAVCEEARKKRPIRGGGKLDAIMNMPMQMGGQAGVVQEDDRDEL
ncbi:hypothetical protein B0A50_05180 [Salinomyces thailandicus]|uniref:Cytochrome b5 heme-binding domain-containing protein n=1 Tax=Salinomyces thailandicus TaxID=706561 RepID=A0A4V5N4B0_9PEZI|nr:hypothetical protein B0A50_05180 [Salinomyces thailandica]